MAIRASDTGQATDDNKLRQIVEPVLASGALSVKSAQIPFSIRDGRIRVTATTLDADGARAVISGGYDIPADQADIRASLASTTVGSAASPPEIQLFAAGSPDALDRTVDVASLSSWLAVRAIDRETRRLDSMERGDPPPALPASIPPSAADRPLSDAPTAGVDPRRSSLKSKAGVPRPPGAPPGGPNPATVSQQLAPLPPPIEVRPVPGPPLVRPKPKPPLTLTPQIANPPRPAF